MRKSIFLGFVLSIFLMDCLPPENKARCGDAIYEQFCSVGAKFDWSDSLNTNDQATVVYFTSVACVNCRKKDPIVVDVFKNLSGKNVDLLVVVVDDREFSNPPSLHTKRAVELQRLIAPSGSQPALGVKFPDKPAVHIKNIMGKTREDFSDWLLLSLE